MKKKNFLAYALMAVALCAGFASCSSDDDEVDAPKIDTEKYHFDLLMSVGGTTGMSTSAITATIMRSVSVSDIENPEYTISMQGQGCDITEQLNAETIIKNGYYYQVAPQKNTWYGKYTIGNTVNTISRYEFGNISFLDRQYTHAWTSDNTLVLIGADRTVSSRGKNPALTNTIQWARLTDGVSLTLQAEGTLDLTEATKNLKENGVTAFSTSGLAAYRESDNTIIYSFVDKATTNAKKGVFVAFIDATSMQIKNVVIDETVDEMCGTSYGELGQDKIFFTEEGDLYIPCGIKVEGAAAASAEVSKIIRIKKDAFDIDRTYPSIATNLDAKIVTADYIGNGKAILYGTDVVKAGLAADIVSSTSANWNQNSFNGFYYLYDINSCTATAITGLPTSANCGTFSDRVTVFNGKAYIGTCPKEPEEARIYIYDIKTGKMTAGAKIENGYYFNRINVLENK